MVPAPVVPAPVLPAPVVLPVPVVPASGTDGPFGLGAAAAGGSAEPEGVADVAGAELVGVPVPLSVLPAPLADGVGDGDGVSVCGVVGVHATIAAMAIHVVAAMRRGCGRYMRQLLRNCGRAMRHRGRMRWQAQNVCATVIESGRTNDV
jgi:hypothetical protein